MTLMCFFLSHSLVALAVCFVSLSYWNTHPRPISNALAGFNALALTVHGPIHRPFDAVQLTCPLSRKTPPNHNVSCSVLDSGDGVLGVPVWPLVFSPAKNGFKSFISIFCCSVSVGNISLHFQILPLIVILQLDFCLYKESENSQCFTQRSDLISIQSVWNDIKNRKLRQIKSRKTVATSPRCFKKHIYKYCSNFLATIMCKML